MWGMSDGMFTIFFILLCCIFFPILNWVFKKLEWLLALLGTIFIIGAVYKHFDDDE